MQCFLNVECVNYQVFVDRIDECLAGGYPFMFRHTDAYDGVFVV